MKLEVSHVRILSLKVNNDELKVIVESNTTQTIREIESKLDISIPTILDHLRQINKVKKLDRWVPHELNTHQMKNVLMLAFLYFRGIKESCFCIVSLHVMKDGSYYDDRKRLASWLDKDEAPKPNIHQKKLMVTAW